MRFGLKQFAAAERGTVAVIAAFGLVPAIAALGLSVDLGRTFVAKNALARAADAAAVAGARSFTEDGVVADVHRYFDANYEPSKLGTDQPVVSPHFDPLTGRITVTATARLQTTFMKVAMIDSLDIEARAVAVREMTGIELALALDVTGSMAGSRMRALKSAAGDLLEIVYGEHDEIEDVHLAIVPFNSRVNVGDGHGAWLREAPPEKWTGCMQARAGGHALDDAPPADDYAEPGGGTSDTRFLAQDHDKSLNDYICPEERLLPLTNRRPDLQDKIDELDAEGATRIDMGLRWGWRTLSPRWKGLWGDPDRPNAEPREVHKILVIMTDGDNVARHYDEVTASGADANVATLCETIKEEGITIFSITFRAPNKVKPMMRACASSENQYFDSPTNGALNDAFGRIGAYISKLRLAE